MAGKFNLRINNTITIREAVYQRLREAIISGRFSPGEQLIERVLSEEMGVSRTPIREALRKLELENLIINIPHHGVVVRELSIKETKHIYEVHAVLEGLAARLSAKFADRATIKEIEKSIKEAEINLQQKQTQDMIAHNRFFHNKLYEVSQNYQLYEIMGNLQANIALLRITTLSVPERAQQNIVEHKRILNAIKNRQGELAEKLAIKHIQNAAKIALLLLKNRAGDKNI